MQQTQPIRFLVDFSLLGYLSIASNCTSMKFFAHAPQENAEEFYEKLLMLNDLVHNGYVELIVPYTVIQELKQTKPNAYVPEHKIEERQEKSFFKNQINIYTHQEENVKFVFCSAADIPHYSRQAEEMAKLYSEMPKYPFQITESYNARKKPFLYFNENISYYATKMAEATMLGLDFLTMDRHFFLKHPVNVAKSIEEINEEEFGSKVKPIKLNSVLKVLKNFDLTQTYKHYINAQPKFTEISLLNFKDFKTETQRALKIKKENFEIITNRTLFLKYLNKPLNLDEPNQKPKSTPQPKQPTKKIKIDFSNPNANEILDDYFKTNKEPQIEK